jgi:hypothetical protein
MSKPDGNVHVVPLDREHFESKDCWCQPELHYKDEETGVEVWTHREIQ